MDQAKGRQFELATQCQIKFTQGGPFDSFQKINILAIFILFTN